MLDNILNGGVMEKLLKSAIPMLIQKLVTVPYEQKLAFASFMGDLCIAYEYKDREQFEKLLEQTSFTQEWKDSLMVALWTDVDQT